MANRDASLGLERTDNGMKPTSWPEVTPINQKNYYTYVDGRDGAIRCDVLWTSFGHLANTGPRSENT